MKPFPTSAACCFGILFISVSLKTTGSSEVVGSADPVVALAGDDVILPCSLKPRVSAEDMVVKWTGLFLETRNVHLYLDGRDSNEEQHPFYSGRTSMFHEELKNGNVSLKLTRVTLSDAGSYRCFIPTLKKETTVQLFVGAVSLPVVSIDGTKGWGVVLKCESGGWYPEPEMEWLDSSGSILPPDGPPERHSDSEGLYTVRQHVTVDQTDTNRFTCRVQQLKINHKKETEFHVPDEVFPKGFPKINIAFIGFGIACTSIPLWCILYDWCEKKQALKKQGASAEEDPSPPSTIQIGASAEEDPSPHCFRRLMASTIQIDCFRRLMDCFRRLMGASAEEDPSPQEVRMLNDEAITEREEVRMQSGASAEEDPSPRASAEEDPSPPSTIQIASTIQIGASAEEDPSPRASAEEDPSPRASAEEDPSPHCFRRLMDCFRRLMASTIQIDVVTRERDELKEQLRKAEETIKTLSTSPGGQQKTQTPSQNELRMQTGQLDEVTRERDELKEQLRKAEVTIKTLSTSPGGQQKTQTPSQKGMEMKPLLGPGMEMKPLLGQKDDLDEMERGGRVTTEVDYRAAVGLLQRDYNYRAELL